LFISLVLIPTAAPVHPPPLLRDSPFILSPTLLFLSRSRVRMGDKVVRRVISCAECIHDRRRWNERPAVKDWRGWVLKGGNEDGDLGSLLIRRGGFAVHWYERRGIRKGGVHDDPFAEEEADDEEYNDD
jgi:hypothetical protein